MTYSLPMTLEQQRHTCQLLDQAVAQAQRFAEIADRLEKKLAIAEKRAAEATARALAAEAVIRWRGGGQ